MKVRADRRELLQAFLAVSAAVPAGKTGIAILQNIKIHAEGKSLSLLATDMEVGVRLNVEEVDIQEPGTLVIPGDRFSAILRESRDEKVAIASDRTAAAITLSDGFYKVVGVDPADFPEFPDFNPKAAPSLPSADLLDMIRRTAFAVAVEVTRYALTGIQLEIRGDEVRMVATDGKRLAYVHRKSATPAKQDLKVIVPPKALHLLEKVLADGDPEVHLNVTESQIKMKTRRAVIFSRLVEGSFPDYEQVLPKVAARKAVVDRQALESAMRRAALLTTAESRATKLTFSEDKLVMVSRVQEVGESKVEVPIKYSGEEFDVVFNPILFTDALKVMTDERIHLEMKDKSSPCVVRDGKEYQYLVMPLSVAV